MPQPAESQGRLLATLIRELMRGETFESVADLVEALKARCARLRIRWDNDVITEALRLIESNTPIVPSRVPAKKRPAEPAPALPVISREEAAAIVAKLSKAPRRMPAAAPIDGRRADRLKALQLVAGEITAAIARGEALENDDKEPLE